MSFLDYYEGTIRVDVGDPAKGYYVELWEHASEADLEEAERMLTQMSIVNNEPSINPDNSGYRQRMILAYIKEWNLDDDGVTWPYTLESVKRLPKGVLRQLWKVVDDLDTPETKEEEKRFHDESGGRDPQRDGRAAKSRKVPARATTRSKAAHQLGDASETAS